MIFYVRYIELVFPLTFLIFLSYCNLVELLIFLSCNIRYVFLSSEQ